MLQKLMIGVMLLLGALGVFVISPPGQDFVTEKLTVRDGSSSYLYGYPLVTMVTAEEQLTASPAAGNTLVHLDHPVDDSGASVPPGFLMSYAWLDLSEGGAFLVETPDLGESYWLMPVLDGWTEVVASPGSRTTGNAPGRFLIAGPGYEGPVPAGAELIESGTGLVWLRVLIAAAGDSDAAAATALRDAFVLLPVTASGEAGQPVEPITLDSTAADPADIRAAVDALPAAEFFNALATALATNPPRPADADAAAGLERLGLMPGEPFPTDGLSSAERSALAQVPDQAQQGMTESAAMGERDAVSNGWRVPPMIVGDYGGAYGFRAIVARDWLGALLPEDLVRAVTEVDAAGQPLDGSKSYELTLPADTPATGLWSVGIGDSRPDSDGFSNTWVSELGSTPRQPDGTVHIVVSPEDPGPGAAWLRPRGGPFSLTLQLGWPEESVLSGEWEYPPVTPLD